MIKNKAKLDLGLVVILILSEYFVFRDAWAATDAKESSISAKEALENGKAANKNHKKDHWEVEKKWFGKAANSGLAEGEYYFGMTLMSEALKKRKINDIKAVQTSVATQGISDKDEVGYEAVLKKVLPLPDDPMIAGEEKEGLAWLQKAANQNYPEAECFLGYVYLGYWPVPGARGDKKALHFYNKAASQGNADGQYFLGKMFENGRGVAKNPKEAVEWYRKAAAQGNDEAKAALKRLNQ